jgi:predicted ATPase
MANQATLRFKIKNFRSVAEGDLEIKPITVLTGANGAGKSSFMYGIMALRNILGNANQPADNFFNLGFVNLGGIKEVVSGKNTRKPIELGCYYSDSDEESSYVASIGPTSFLRLKVDKPYKIDLKVDISFPYPMVQNAMQEIFWKGRKYRFIFNGINLSVVPADGDTTSHPAIDELESSAHVPQAITRLCDYVDVKRGFFRNTYASLSAATVGEDEVASLLGSDRDLEARVSLTLEKMINKSFTARHTSLGASTFYLQTTDRETGFVCDLVNEGFGINQLVYLLAKALRRDGWLICIEEPETHLHPEALAKLAEQLLRITKSESNRFLIASHSEHFVVSLLNLVAQGKASTDDIGIHFVAKDEHNLTKIAEQKVNKKGQIEGGLRSFYEPGIRALEDFLGSRRDTEHVNPAK